MNINRGIDGHWYAVFKTNFEAERMSWFFWGLLRRPRSCFGQYDNAYRLI